ncbi:hypothetical protein [Actinomadura logoneensis]|uniref:hypothetical protein n=1 Tax=Actinomadura logoneensis TaxID=2293572 RepID=UPI0018F25E12|nr:hypothetical protein [Actinomadura logoneensis]
MQALLALIVTGLLVAFCVRWVAGRLRLGAPTRMAVIVIFMLVALALYGHQLGG